MAMTKSQDALCHIEIDDTEKNVTMSQLAHRPITATGKCRNMFLGSNEMGLITGA